MSHCNVWTAYPIISPLFVNKQQLDLSLYVYFHVHVMHSTGNGVTASREDAVFIPEYLPLHVSVML